MGGLKRYMPVTFATMGIATLAIAGVPPFAGFFSKDEIIGAAFAGANGYSGLSDQMLLGIEGRYVMGFIWGTLSIAALMTAFYMGRLMIYTFFGPNRTGDPERAHLHEAGPTMTIPLIVLAALSVFGGFLNVVDAPIVRWFDFGQGTALHRWLHPVIEGAEGVMAVNMNMPDYVPHPLLPILIAIAIGLAGLLLAWFLLKPAALRDAETEPSYSDGLGKALYNKWYVDEVYDRIVVRPVGALSRAFSSVVDRGVIDGIVDGAGRLAQGVGLLAVRIQTGQVNTYAFVILVGVLAVLGAFVAL
jgi:NADH-quinone oxidoreductase subunit L